MADHSRMLRLASEATDRPESELLAHLERSSVSIGFDPAIPGVPLAARFLMRMLRRMPGTISVDPGGLPGGLVDQLVSEAAAIDPDRPIGIGTPVETDVRVRLAATAPNGTLRALPDLHGYRLRGGDGPVRQHRPASALGSASVAAAVAGELFKTLAAVKPARGLPHQALSFCPVTLTDRPEDGPELPAEWRIRAMIVGVGAIGTGSALILSELPCEGTIDLVDPERFGPENVGTYSLGGAAEGQARPFKADLAAAVLHRFEAHARQVYARDVPALIDRGEVPWPAVVLSGPDSAEARREAQRIRADGLIDGATGGSMVGLHVTTGDGRPCMSCFLPNRRRSDTSGLEVVAAATGLPVALLVRGAERLTDEHLVGLTSDQLALMRPYLGGEICGLVSAVGLSDLGSTGYQPAVPFVSLTAATLVIGRLIAQDAGVEPLSNFIQFDALAGPTRMTAVRRVARPGCECIVQHAIIEAVRRHRRGAS